MNNTSFELPSLLCFPGNVTFSCFDPDLNHTHVTPARWTTSDPVSALATAVVMLVFTLVSVPCNLLIVFVMLKKKLYKLPAHILLLNLALNGLVIGFSYMPIHVVTAFAGEFVFGPNDVIR